MKKNILAAAHIVSMSVLAVSVFLMPTASEHAMKTQVRTSLAVNGIAFWAGLVSFVAVSIISERKNRRKKDGSRAVRAGKLFIAADICIAVAIAVMAVLDRFFFSSLYITSAIGSAAVLYIGINLVLRNRRSQKGKKGL